MQSTKLDLPLSSKEMCNIIENDTWNRLGFSRSTSYCPVLNNVTRSVSSLVQKPLLNAVQTTISKEAVCICKEKMRVSHMLLSFQHMQSYLSPEWSSAGHVHLSLRTLLLEKRFFSIHFLPYHLINSPIRHYFESHVVVFWGFFFSVGWGRGMVYI